MEVSPMPNSNARKPDLPYEGFPLFPHANGQWAKKVRGKLRYFGKWAEPMEALQKWNDQQADLYAGREPRPPADGRTVRDLLNRFRTAKKRQWEAGDLAERSYFEYVDTCDLVAVELHLDRALDELHPEDFTELKAVMASRWGPTRLGNEIQRVRSVFKYALDVEMVPKPMNFGPHFSRPSRRKRRLVQAERGDRTIPPDELRRLIKQANRRLKPMILLGINGGFGPKDCVELPLAAVDLDGGWIDYARAKTGVPRRVPLWQETILAIKAYQFRRPATTSDVLFVARHGQPDPNHQNVSRQFTRLARKYKVERTFYDLRRTFQTIGEEAGETACKAIMGHAPDESDMAATYRQWIRDSRLAAVVEHVRQWLFGGCEENTT
jgi:integrase